jgi:hypothetical protein
MHAVEQAHRFVDRAGDEDAPHMTLEDLREELAHVFIVVDR